MLVSIIMPVYNAERFLRRSIESVISQNYKKIELILVDDGSLDNSKKICEKYAKTDRRIKLIAQKNSGPASARNMGIRYAKGDFVFFLDADDLIEENTLSTLIQIYKKYKTDLTMSNFKKLETSGKTIKQNVTFTPEGEVFNGELKELNQLEILEFIRHFYKYPSNHLMSYCWARLYKTEILKNMNLDANKGMRLFEDYVFNLEYLKHADKMTFVNQNLYTYIMQNTSQSMKILNSESLIHDMNLFKIKTNEFLDETKVDETLKSKIKKEIRHTLIHYTIIFLVRSCRQINNENKKKIYSEIYTLINSPIIRESLDYYKPSKGNSRIMPALMRLKLVRLIMFVCNQKAIKRYGKLEENPKHGKTI